MRLVAEVHPLAAELKIAVGSDGVPPLSVSECPIIDLSEMQGGTAEIIRPSLSFGNGGLLIL